MLTLSDCSTSDSENHSAPSGPPVIMEGCLWTENSEVVWSVVVIRPILSPWISVNHMLMPNRPRHDVKGGPTECAAAWERRELVDDPTRRDLSDFVSAGLRKT